MKLLNHESFTNQFWINDIRKSHTKINSKPNNAITTPHERYSKTMEHYYVKEYIKLPYIKLYSPISVLFFSTIQPPTQTT